jgi:hypothetical protein
MRRESFVVEMLFSNSEKVAVIPTVFSKGAIILRDENVNMFCGTGHNLRWRDKDMSLPAIWRPSSLTRFPPRCVLKTHLP